MNDEEWRVRRREAAAAQAARFDERQAAEHARAAELLARFVAVAREQLPAEPLRVRGYGGRGSTATPLRGWYLRRDQSVGVDVTGNFYVLTAPLSLLDRVRGLTPDPTPPPLVIGAGGKDGESIDLVDALERLLPGWRRHEPPDSAG